jgi:hypothetical protein
MQVQLAEAYDKLPLSFEINRGQTDSQVKFLSRSTGYTLFLTSSEAVLALRKAESSKQNRERDDISSHFHPLSFHVNPSRFAETVLRMKLIDANLKPQIEGLDKLPGKSNYFIGNDPQKWYTNIPTYAKVKYQEVYPGIDLVYYGNQRQLEYDFVVSPGADPKVIQLAFEGANGLETSPTGDLILHTIVGNIRLHKPQVYQEINGTRQVIPGNYLLLPRLLGENKDEDIQKVSFQVAAYDRDKPLIIDPVLSYSTYLGGSAEDFGAGIAVDAAGNAYVIGTTTSVDFPTENPLQPSHIGFAFKSTDGGNSWSAINNGFPGTLTIRTLAIDPIIPSTLYAGTDFQGVFKSTDGGNSWSVITSGLPRSS